MALPNPYGHLLVQMRMLVQSESRMPPEARRPHSWMLRADFADTHCTIIKGGANTIIVQLGDHRRDPCYPDDAMHLLAELKSQPCHVYWVVLGERRRIYHRLADALAVAPRAGMRIGGAIEDQRTITHDARTNAAGKMRWVARQ